MNLSYWEYNSWFSNTDYTLVGGGIVGLSCALHLRTRFPDARILVLEKGALPRGASTKNAGFACFGSASELLSDLENHSEEEVMTLVRKRWQGIQNLRNLLGDKALDYHQYGGHEVFLKEHRDLYMRCADQLDYLNSILKPLFGRNAFRKQPNIFGFGGVMDHYISHDLEGQIDTGRMMQALMDAARKKNIHVLNGVDVQRFETMKNDVLVQTDQFELNTKHLLVTTNGFASQLLKEPVKPARAQVLITTPLNNLNIRGSFHIDRGYYYFRNIHNRILIGGGRNLDFEGETTMEFGQSPIIQNRLEQLLREVVLPGIPFEISHRWSGIMGLGTSKDPIIRQLSDRVYCGVRLGGMGIAIGSLVGKELAGMVG